MFLTGTGWVIRNRTCFYTIHLTRMESFIKEVRQAKWQVVMDVSGLAQPPSQEGDGTAREPDDVKTEPVAEKEVEDMATKDEETLTLAPTKLRQGAKFKRLLESLELSDKDSEKAVEAAIKIARKHKLPNGRIETILRDYYLYQALKLDMPASIQKQWEHFERTGVELAAGNAKAGSGKTESGKGKAEPGGKSNGTEMETTRDKAAAASDPSAQDSSQEETL